MINGPLFDLVQGCFLLEEAKKWALIGSGLFPIQLSFRPQLAVAKGRIV